MQPSAPIYTLDQPFAYDGDKTIIPSTEASAEGRATLALGFPPVTQLPVASGGIAPNRWDFNGILYLLSSMAFWQQSGGQMTWNSELGYTPPAIVFYNNVFYACVAESGPDVDAGAVTPGTDTDYWVTLYDYINNNDVNAVQQGNTVTLTGDATGSGSFDSSGDVSITTTLSKTGVTAGSYGPTAAVSPGYNGSVNVPQITVDAKGRATSVVNRAVTFPDEQTDITGNAATATKLKTARTIKLTGDVTGSSTFDGSANCTIETTVTTNTGSMVPDWANIEDREPGVQYTAETNGYALVKWGASKYYNFYVNGLSWNLRDGGGEWGFAAIPIAEGDTYQFMDSTGSFSSGNNLQWVPCK